MRASFQFVRSAQYAARGPADNLGGHEDGEEEAMTTAAVSAGGRVGRIDLVDGTLVQLSGSLTGENLPELRAALLSSFAESCRDVVVDAGEVGDVTQPALAVLVAAQADARRHGRRFLLSRLSAPLAAALAAYGVGLPLLGAPGAARAARFDRCARSRSRSSAGPRCSSSLTCPTRNRPPDSTSSR
jgi:anti-anti-sigma regulatory factor